MGLSSCKHLYYQVYDVKSDALKQEDNSLVYENGDMKVMYNFWGKDGSVGFILQNKTDKDLFIDMDKTFFILNGEANDYFKNREYTTSTTEIASMGFGVSQTFWSANGFWPTQYYVATTASALSKLVKGQSHGVTTKEKQIVCIPAHAYKVINEYKVSPRFVKTCERTKDFPKRTAIVASYSEGSSPVKFKNRIAYSFDSDCKNLQHIENSFYVSGVTNYSKKAAVQKVREKIDCYCTQKQKRAYFKIGGPDKFYKTYRSQGVNGSSDMYE
jgi:hypothetical protein